MTLEGKYIYGVINSGEKREFGRTGKDGKEVYTIPHKDISCVVSDSDGLNLEMMEKEELGRYLVKHQTVIEEVMREHTIIPMKFGTEVEGIVEVEEILETGYSEFRDRLKGFYGKIELDVTAVWADLNKTIKAIGEEEKEIRELKREIAKKPPDETFQDRIRIGAMIKTALEKKNEETQEQISDVLREKAIEFRKHETMDDTMISNCAYLLDKEKEAEFDEALNEVDKRYDGLINFKCVGPLPPYSFTTMGVKKIDVADLREARALLGLGEEITLDEIKESYRRKTLEFHPDKDPDNPALARKFEEITRSYKMLKNFCEGDKYSFKGGDAKDLFLIEPMEI